MRWSRLPLIAWGAVCLLLLGAGGASASGATVLESDFSFSPSTVTVTSGSTLGLQNVTAATPHTFTISGQGIDVLTNGGQSGSVAINLPAGTYPFFCRFHSSLGMTGTLVVRSAGSGTGSTGVAPLGGPQTGAGGTAHRSFPFLPVIMGSVLVAAAGLLTMRGRRV